MDKINISNTYHRLLEIKLEVEQKPLPDPRYISEKIMECHGYIEEVEKFAIRVHQEMSMVQRYLNDKEAEYATRLESLIVDDPAIKELPSIKDREASAKSKLKTILNEIKDLKSEESDLNNLLRAITLKNKNLNRANVDIKLQLRVMEAQSKLGVPYQGSESAERFYAEMNKGVLNQDTFEDAETSEEEESIVDPTVPLDINAILGSDMSNNMIDPDGDPSPMSDPETLEEIEIPGLPLEKDLPWDEDPSPEAVQEAEKVVEEIAVDLDAVILNTSEKIENKPKTEKGGSEQKEVTKPKTIEEETIKPPPAEESSQKTTNDIDVDSLLSQFS